MTSRLVGWAAPTGGSKSYCHESRVTFLLAPEMRPSWAGNLADAKNRRRLTEEEVEDKVASMRTQPGNCRRRQQLPAYGPYLAPILAHLQDLDQYQSTQPMSCSRTLGFHPLHTTAAHTNSRGSRRGATKASSPSSVLLFCSRSRCSSSRLAAADGRCKLVAARW